jgi:hypothetical protein
MWPMVRSFKSNPDSALSFRNDDLEGMWKEAIVGWKNTVSEFACGDSEKWGKYLCEFGASV